MALTRVSNNMLVQPVNHNILINPAFTVNQRGPVSVSDSATIFDFVSDRWTHRPANLVGVGFSSEPVIINGQGTGIKLSYDSATTGAVFLQQDIEAVNVYQLYAKQVTISFNANNVDGINALTETLIDVNIWKKDQTAIVCNPVGGLVYMGGTRYSQTFDVGTMSDPNLPDPSERGMRVRIHPTVNGGLTEWKLWNVKLEAGSVATPFIARQYGEELALCQRYYQVYATGSVVNQCFGNFANWDGQSGYGGYLYPQRMRAGPSSSYSGALGAYWGTAGKTTPVTEFFPQNMGVGGLEIQINFSAGFTPTGGWWRLPANFELKLDAEL